MNLPPIPSLRIETVHILYFLQDPARTLLLTKGIQLLHFEEVESLLKQWSYKKDERKAKVCQHLYIGVSY